VTPHQAARAAGKLAKRCYPIFKGQDPDIQSAALCDLVARHLAGHVAIGDAEATAQMREMLLEAFIIAVKQLVPIVDAAEIQPELRRRTQ
jgi:hypothetical protein